MEAVVLTWLVLAILPAAWLVFAMAASGMAHSRGSHWVYGLIVGALFGPAGLLWIYIRTGRTCWHCWTKIHLNTRRCPHCHGDVVDRRKGRASRSGFGRRREDGAMRAPADAPQAAAG